MSLGFELSAPVAALIMGGAILLIAAITAAVWVIEDRRHGRYLATNEMLRDRHPGDHGSLHVIDDDYRTLFGEGAIITNPPTVTPDPVNWDDVQNEAGR